MSKKSITVILFTVLILALSISMGNEKAYAASIGDRLTSAEAGWSRYPDTDRNITYAGSNWATWSASILTDGVAHWTSSTGTAIKFNFTGDKIRILSEVIYHNTKNVEVKIDGVYQGSFSEYRSTQVGSVLVYEKTGLSYGEHSIELTTLDTSSGVQYVLDGIDLGAGEILLPYHKISAKALIDIKPERYNVNLNEEVQADLVLNKSSESIKNEEMTIVYDNTKLKYLGANVSDGVRLYKNLDEAGQIKIVCKNKNIDERQILLKLKFKTISSGNAYVKVGNADISTRNNKIRSLISDECGEDVIIIK